MHLDSGTVDQSIGRPISFSDHRIAIPVDALVMEDGLDSATLPLCADHLHW